MRPNRCIVLIITAIVGAGGVAQAQTGGARPDTGARAGVSDRIGPGTRWGSGFELSDGGLARSGSPAKDEAYVVIRDTLGSLTLGPEAGAAHRMTVGRAGIWATGFGSSSGAAARPRRDWALDGSAGLTSGLGSLLGEEVRDKITYYTPWFAGIRLGLSYTPSFELGAGRSADSAGAAYRDGIAVRANFDRQFDRFGIGVVAGYAAAEASDDVATPDMDAWTIAARFDFGGSFDGLRVSGEFMKNSDPPGDAPTTATPGSGEAWNIGARYLWGRNDVRLAYGHGDSRAVIATPGDDGQDAATLSYARTFGRGVKWSVNLYWADTASEAARGSDDNDGMALTTGLRLNF